MSRHAILLVPFLVSALVVLAAGPATISALRRRNAAQPISPDAPEKHRLKHGTPTMGGILIAAAMIVAVAVGTVCFDIPFRRLSGVWAVSGVFVGGAVVGLLDDLGKARRKENKAGLSERAKLFLQLAVAVGFAIWMRGSGITSLVGPYDIGFLFLPFVVLFVAGFGNAANFTDGLDGLLSGSAAIVALVLGVVLGETGRRPELAIPCGAVAGACVAFLAFNAYPARVFMGDTGSLALGMGLAAVACAGGMVPVFLVAAVVWIAEIASMVLQRYVFKFRRIRHGIEYAKAHRVFRRAPLHHHFEECGWHETQVVARFHVVGILAGVVALLAWGAGL
ncbi:MAG: phospho-N-acetylmuramoyl-pentapeptide-transferase [Armatimonadota bacterium]